MMENRRKITAAKTYLFKKIIVREEKIQQIKINIDQ
jgi:hypothetical protein